MTSDPVVGRRAADRRALPAGGRSHTASTAPAWSSSRSGLCGLAAPRLPDQLRRLGAAVPRNGAAAPRRPHPARRRRRPDGRRSADDPRQPARRQGDGRPGRHPRPARIGAAPTSDLRLPPPAGIENPKRNDRVKAIPRATRAVDGLHPEPKQPIFTLLGGQMNDMIGARPPAGSACLLRGVALEPVRRRYLSQTSASLPAHERAAALAASMPAWVTAAFAVAVFGGALGALGLLMLQALVGLLLLFRCSRSCSSGWLDVRHERAPARSQPPNGRDRRCARHRHPAGLARHERPTSRAG